MRSTIFRPGVGRWLTLALLALLALPGLLGLTGCINTRPRPMSVACTMSPAQFVERCSALLTANNYQLIEADPSTNPARVRATRGQRQTNIGENIQYHGPYLLTATYAKGGPVIVTVATTMRRGSGGEEQPLILHTHDEGSGTNPADRQAFAPIMEGLRRACAQP